MSTVRTSSERDLRPLAIAVVVALAVAAVVIALMTLGSGTSSDSDIPAGPPTEFNAALAAGS